MIELWDVQQKMVADIRAAYRAKFRAPLLVSPTGSGKTVMFAYMASNHVKRGGRVLILVHRQELIEQVCETLDKFDQWYSVIAPDYLYDSTAPVQIASVFTLVRRLETLRWTPTLIIIDEAHHAVAATTWGKILAKYDCHILGVTATPVRLSGEGLGESFDTLVLGPGPQDLIDRGYLSPFRVFCPSSPDLSRVHTRAGELVGSEIENDPQRPRLIGDAVGHYQRIADGRQAVAFCLSVQDANNVAQRFRDSGVLATSVDGTMPKQYRRDIIRDFKNRTLRVLTSCDLISEGFDCPGIEVGISLRPTLSLALWLQQIGRCLRTAPGKKEAIILDHAGNALKHGLPTETREWSLSGCKSSNPNAESVPRLKVCSQCWATNPVTRSTCKECGKPFDVTPRTVPRKEGTLEEHSPEQIAALRYKETQQDKKSLEFLTELGKKRGYRNPAGWAQHVINGQKQRKARKVTT